jgi:hypothetical protein
MRPRAERAIEETSMELSGKSVAVLVENNHQDLELWYPTREENGDLYVDIENELRYDHQCEADA